MAGFSTAESPLAGSAGKNGAKYAQNRDFAPLGLKWVKKSVFSWCFVRFYAFSSPKTIKIGPKTAFSGLPAFPKQSPKVSDFGRICDRVQALVMLSGGASRRSRNISVLLLWLAGCIRTEIPRQVRDDSHDARRLTPGRKPPNRRCALRLRAVASAIDFPWGLWDIFRLWHSRQMQTVGIWSLSRPRAGLTCIFRICGVIAT